MRCSSCCFFCFHASMLPWKESALLHLHQGFAAETCLGLKFLLRIYDRLLGFTRATWFLWFCHLSLLLQGSEASNSHEIKYLPLQNTGDSLLSRAPATCSSSLWKSLIKNLRKIILVSLMPGEKKSCLKKTDFLSKKILVINNFLIFTKGNFWGEVRGFAKE